MLLDRGFFFSFCPFFLEKDEVEANSRVVNDPLKIGGASRTKLSGFLCNLGVADELNTLTEH
jgi:hypothetical protein